MYGTVWYCVCLSTVTCLCRPCVWYCVVLCVPQYCNLSLQAMCGHLMPLQAAALVFQLQLWCSSCFIPCLCHVVHVSQSAMEWQRCGIEWQSHGNRNKSSLTAVVASSQGCLKIQALENAPCGSYVSEGF